MLLKPFNTLWNVTDSLWNVPENPLKPSNALPSRNHLNGMTKALKRRLKRYWSPLKRFWKILAQSMAQWERERDCLLQRRSIDSRVQTLEIAWYCGFNQYFWSPSWFTIRNIRFNRNSISKSTDSHNTKYNCLNHLVTVAMLQLKTASDIDL